MPREELYGIRNVEKQEVDFLVFRMHPTSAASR